MASLESLVGTAKKFVSGRDYFRNLVYGTAIITSALGLSCTETKRFATPNSPTTVIEIPNPDAEPYIRIIEPNGGQYSLDSQIEVKWVSVNVPESASIDLKLRAQDSSRFYLGTSPNDGKEIVNFQNVPPGRYRMEIQTMLDSKLVFDESDGEIELTAPKIELPPTGETVTLIGAGDIARCLTPNGPAAPEAEATARIIDRFPDARVIFAGDNAYPANEQGYRNCLDPTWGRFKDRSFPAEGNHEREDNRGSNVPFRSYFASRLAELGSSPDTYYAVKSGTWLVIVLNSEVSIAENSSQWNFLKRQLEANTSICTLAIWHRPLFAYSVNGPYPPFMPAWQLLYENNADVVVNAHEHLYERSAPQTPFGQRDMVRGLMQIISGTGGASSYQLRPGPNTEIGRGLDPATGMGVYGVTKFTLRPGSVDWEFIPASIPSAQPFHDMGTMICH